MNRYDDHLLWKLLKQFGIPFLTTIITASIIWGAFREKVIAFEKINSEHRLTTLESNYENLNSRTIRMEDKLDRILERLKR